MARSRSWFSSTLGHDLSCGPSTSTPHPNLMLALSLAFHASTSFKLWEGNITQAWFAERFLHIWRRQLDTVLVSKVLCGMQPRHSGLPPKPSTRSVLDLLACIPIVLVVDEDKYRAACRCASNLKTLVVSRTRGQPPKSRP
eukprot:52919-Amphidinium_carterae.1